MKKLILAFAFVQGLIYGCFAQKAEKNKTSGEDKSVKYATTITKEDLSKHLHIIAADSMEGRYTGSAGQKKAAKYIANHFKSLGLLPPVNTDAEKSYFQVFKLVNLKFEEVYIKFGDQKLEFIKDIYVLGNSNMDKEEKLDVVFGGSANQESLAKLNVSGKVVMCFSDIEEPEEVSKLLKKNGAKTLLIVQKNFAEEVEYNSYTFTRGSQELSGVIRKEKAIFYISESAAAKLMNTTVENLLAKKSEAGAFEANAVIFKAKMKEEPKFSSENVLGFLEGTDKKDEVLVITAHYDHIGIAKNGDVNNGADDDGSGTVTVLELAEAFAKAKAEGNGPRRSILFMTVAGEELGLYGSSFYADYEPVFPLENTVADLNIDMVGRIGGEYIKKNDPNYVYLIGSDKLSTDLHNLSEEMNKKYSQLKLDYEYNDESDPNRFYYRSDHYNFAKNNIHADYHQPSDEVDKIHFPKMEKIGRLVFHTAWEIANREERLKVDKK
jgi:hypothetical protein